jgi:hypothetical protein
VLKPESMSWRFQFAAGGDRSSRWSVKDVQIKNGVWTEHSACCLIKTHLQIPTFGATRLDYSQLIHRARNLTNRSLPNMSWYESSRYHTKGSDWRQQAILWGFGCVGSFHPTNTPEWHHVGSFLQMTRTISMPSSPPHSADSLSPFRHLETTSPCRL